MTRPDEPLNEIVADCEIATAPKLRRTNKGTAIFSAGITIPPPKLRADPLRLGIVAFAAVAEAAQDFQPGDRIRVSGALFLDVWHNNAGEQRTRITIRAAHVELLHRAGEINIGSTY